MYQELQLPPANPNLEEGEEIEFLADLPSIAFIPPAEPRARANDKLELEAPDLARFASPDGSMASTGSGSGLSQYETVSEGSSEVGSIAGSTL